MKRQLAYLLILLPQLMSYSGWCQTPRIDSLRRVLEMDSTNLGVLTQLAAMLADKDDVEAMMHAARAKLIALAEGDTAYIVRSSRLLGQLYNRQSNVRMAIEELAPLLSIAERHSLKDENKRILNSLAISFNNLGEYDRALDYHLKSLTAKSKDNDKEGVAVSLNNIGLLYYRMENYRRALYYWTQCLDLKLEINDSYDLAALYLNLGLCYDGLQDFKKANENLMKTLPSCLPNCSDKILIERDYAMGKLKFHEKNLDDARSHFNKSLRLAREKLNLEYEIENLLGLTELALAENDLSAAREYRDKISAIDGKEQFATLLQAFHKLSNVYYLKMKNVDLANHYEREYFLLDEKINGSEMHRRIMEIQMNFVEKENRQEFESQQTLLEAQAKVINNQHIINLLLLGVAILTVSLLIVFFKMNRRKADINRRLDELVMERTFELEESRNQLVQSFNKQQIVLSMISSKLLSTLATVTGLANLAKLEEFENQRDCLARVENVLLTLIEAIKPFGEDSIEVNSKKNIPGYSNLDDPGY